MKKAIGTYEGQREVTTGSLMLGLFICMASYLLVSRELAAGVLFSLILTLANYQVLGFILSRAIGFPSNADKGLWHSGVPIGKRLAAVLYYHLRFWVVVAILYLVIPKSSMLFVVGTLVGFLIPKIVMGAVLITGRGEEWWLNINPQVEKPAVKEEIPPANEYLNKNPFVIDPIENEVQKYSKKLRKIK